MNKLTEQQEKSIKEEAEILNAEWERQLMTESKEQLIYLYKKQILYSNNLRREQASYIAAATKYQEMAKPVLEALQEMLRQFKPEFQHWNQQAAVEHAMDAITNYNESLKG